MHRDDGLLIDLPALPAGVTRKALRDFLRAGLADAGYRGFALSRAIPECSILRVTNLTTGTSRLRGIVRIRPAKAGMAAMETLKGRLLLGAPVRLRRHRHATDFTDDGAHKSRYRDSRCGAQKIELIDD
jgi:hypothetical protein